MDDENDSWSKVVDALNVLFNAKSEEERATAAEAVQVVVNAYSDELEAPEPPPELAGIGEITAFSTAATALAPLTVRMRAAVIHSLDTLLLPPFKRPPLLNKEQIKLFKELFPQIFQMIMSASRPPEPVAYGIPAPQPQLTPQQEHVIREQIRRAGRPPGMSDAELEEMMKPAAARQPFVVSPDGTVHPPQEPVVDREVIGKYVGTVVIDDSGYAWLLRDGQRAAIPSHVLNEMMKMFAGDAAAPLS